MITVVVLFAGYIGYNITSNSIYEAYIEERDTMAQEVNEMNIQKLREEVNPVYSTAHSCL